MIYDIGDSFGTKLDRIVLSADISPLDVTLSRTGLEYVDLNIAIKGTPDVLTVKSYFVSDGASDFTIECIEFADGTVWQPADVMAQMPLTGGDGDDILVGYASADVLTGGAGSDQLYGLNGNDTLTGGAGNDTLDGSYGSDVYMFNRGDGVDTIVNSDSDMTAVDTIMLGSNIGINDVTLTRDSSGYLDIAINGTADVVKVANFYTVVAGYRYDGISILFAHGTIWDATTIKGKTSDIYGTAASDTLTGDVTVNHLYGLAGDDTLYGLGGDDVLEGGDGVDLLDGGAGIDTMLGGLGNDTYVVTAGDIVTEAFNEGVDLVQSDVTFSLALVNNVENLTLTGTAAINGTGNALNNVLTGNSAINTLTGGAGDDTFVITTGDIVTEALNEGTDTVQSGKTYTLTANVENLTLTGTTAINGTGNTLNNIITGNSAVNTLSGGAGADIMIGGAGNDTYVVDNIADMVTELAREGTDLVQTTVSYTLSANVENLTLTGTTAINGTGNTLDNMIIGNTGANILNGGNGNDLLTGGTGIDHFQFTTALGVGNVDTITDFVSGTDKIDLSKTIFTAFSGLAVGSALANTEIGNHIRYTAATGVLSYDADGSAGAGAEVQIALVGTISHPASLLGTDFYMTA